MPLPDELERLSALHERGALTDDEFVQAKKRLLEAATDEPPKPKSTLDGLRRSIHDRWIGGVCGGLGEVTGVPAWSWRILFVLTAFLHGLGVLMYILLWIFVPVQVVAPQPAAVPKE